MSRFVFTALGQFEGCFFHSWTLLRGFLLPIFRAVNDTDFPCSVAVTSVCGWILIHCFFGWKRVKLCAPSPTQETNITIVAHSKLPAGILVHNRAHLLTYPLGALFLLQGVFTQSVVNDAGPQQSLHTFHIDVLQGIQFVAYP